MANPDISIQVKLMEGVERMELMEDGGSGTLELHSEDGYHQLGSHANTAILGSRQPASPSRWLPRTQPFRSGLQSSASGGWRGWAWGFVEGGGGGPWQLAAASLSPLAHKLQPLACRRLLLLFSPPSRGPLSGGTHGTKRFR